MPTVSLDNTDKKYNVEMTTYTLVIYEQEFSTPEKHADIIGDTLGKVMFAQSVEEVVTSEFVESKLQAQYPNGKRIPKPVREAIEAAFPAYIQTAVDYSTTNWTQYLKCVWAMLRTADELEPNPLKQQVPTTFNEWIRKSGMLDMNKVSNVINEVFIPACFPAER